jgi:hypothetical protein
MNFSAIFINYWDCFAYAGKDGILKVNYWIASAFRLAKTKES